MNPRVGPNGVGGSCHEHGPLRALDTRNRPRRICALLVALVAFGLCGAARAAEKATVVLDWLPGGTKAVVYVAVAEGFFAREGLDVTIEHARGTTDALTKLAVGHAQFATGGMSSLYEAIAESKIPVKAVMSFFSKQPDALFVVKDSKIKTISDVVGATVGTTTFTSSNTLWPVFLAKNSIDPSTVKLMKFDPGAIAAMLATGRVDATINWVTQAVTFQDVLAQAGKELRIIPWSDFGLDGYGWSLFVSDTVAKQQPDMVRAFVRAMAKAVEFSIANPALAGRSVNAIAPAVAPDKATAEFKTTIALIKNEVSDKYGMGTFEPALLKKTWLWVAESQKYAPDRVEPEAAVDRSFVK
jgi:NitT/TauT family transport system substrate-binding protein